jgi:cytoskeletal protein CcmA (bactofilin family)
VANIGKSISIKGDLTGNEDLVIEGKVEGKITLPSGQVTIGADGKVTADLSAKSVVIVGRVKGNVRATERAEIHSSGVLEGDVHAPRLVVQEGAVLKGSVLMDSEAQPGASRQAASSRAGLTTGEKRAPLPPGVDAPPPHTP